MGRQKTWRTTRLVQRQAMAYALVALASFPSCEDSRSESDIASRSVEPKVTRENVPQPSPIATDVQRPSKLAEGPQTGPPQTTDAAVSSEPGPPPTGAPAPSPVDNRDCAPPWTYDPKTGKKSVKKRCIR